MTKQRKPDEQGDALTSGAIATMRELGFSEAQIEAQRQAAERIRAAGGFKNWVVMCEAARIASEARGYTVQPEVFTPTWFQDARAKLDSMAGKPMRTSIFGWADHFALELAVLNGKEKADRMLAHRFEQAMLHAARNGNLRMRTFDIVGAPVEVTTDMPDDAITQRLGVDTVDLRVWVAVHWPALMQSRLLAEPTVQKSAPGDEESTLPLKTTEVLQAFSFVFANHQTWKQMLSDKRSTIAQGAIKGNTGKGRGAQNLFDPVCIAENLVKNGIDRSRLSTAFRTENLLKPWEAKWKATMTPFGDIAPGFAP